MKKIGSIFALVLILVLSFPQVVCANMSEPKRPDIGSAITFEKNDAVSVLSEVLNITVHGAEADIVATYTMKNTTNKDISTESMFLSPNIKSSNVSVAVDGKETDFTTKSYALNYKTQIKKEDWQYAVLTDESIESNFKEQTVDTIIFKMNFSSDEEYDVVVSYTYCLGGYPDYDFDVKRGEIKYYLTPAAMWKDFSNLTINLYLDENMPIIKESSLDFKKIRKCTYQYISDTMPDKDLEMVIDENWLQNIKSTIKSPYNKFIFYTIVPCVLICLIITAFIIRYIIKKKIYKKYGIKNKTHKGDQ